MSTFEDLDAFKACHQLTLAVARMKARLEERDGELAARLWTAGIVASSRIARGSGYRNKKLFRPCVDRTAAALAEFGAYPEVARELEVIFAGHHRELEGLGGRALVYVTTVRVPYAPP